MRSGRVAALLSCLAACGPLYARAAELPHTPNWGDMAQAASMTSQPQVCIASSDTTPSVIFRSDADGIQLKMSSAGWSLPLGVQGRAIVSVGDWTGAFSLSGNSATMISAPMDKAALAAMLAAMANASSMSVKVQTMQPAGAQLADSAKPINSFQRCSESGGGFNPRDTASAANTGSSNLPVFPGFIVPPILGSLLATQSTPSPSGSSTNASPPPVFIPAAFMPPVFGVPQNGQKHKPGTGKQSDPNSADTTESVDGFGDSVITDGSSSVFTSADGISGTGTDNPLAVPEPSSFMMLGVAALTLLFRRRLPVRRAALR